MDHQTKNLLDDANFKLKHSKLLTMGMPLYETLEKSLAPLWKWVSNIKFYPKVNGKARLLCDFLIS